MWVGVEASAASARLARWGSLGRILPRSVAKAFGSERAIERRTGVEAVRRLEARLIVELSPRSHTTSHTSPVRGAQF